MFRFLTVAAFIALVALCTACGPGKKEVEAAAKPCADRLNAAWKARAAGLSTPVTPSALNPPAVFGFDNPAVNAAIVGASEMRKGAGAQRDRLHKIRDGNKTGITTNDLRNGVDWIQGRWPRKAQPVSLIKHYTGCAKYRYVLWVDELKLLKPTTDVVEGSKRTGSPVSKLVDKNAQMLIKRRSGLFFPGELWAQVTVVDLDNAKIVANWLARAKSGPKVRGNLVKNLFDRLEKQIHKTLEAKFLLK